MSASGLGVTLQLLQGPTKSLVASALGAGLGASVLLGAAAPPALSYAFRLPYDEDVIQVG